VAEKLRVGVIGLGGIANYHVQAFLDSGAELVACCDIKPDVLTQFADRYAVVERYTDYKEMLHEVDLDIVVICTNETLHAEMTVQAAVSGPRAILCEKPMAMNLGEADEMLRKCNESNVLLVIGHQRRYKPQYARAKELLQEGIIGKLYEIHATGHPYTSLLVDGTHTVDLIRFYLDDAPAEWVFGQVDVRTRRKGWGHVLEDAAMAIIRFSTGVRAFMTLGGHITQKAESLGASCSGGNYHRIVLYGSEGLIEINGDRSDPGQPLVRVVRGNRTSVINVDPESWHKDLSPQADLLRALDGSRTHPLDGKSARATLEILLSVYESARLNRLITLPLQIKENPLELMLAEQQPHH